MNLILLHLAGPSAPEEFSANLSSDFVVRLMWKKPKEINGQVVRFKVKMLYNIRNEIVKKVNVTEIQAHVSSARRRARRGVAEFKVLKMRPYREMEIRDLQPYTDIVMRVAEGAKGINNKMLWGPFSNSQKIVTPEGGMIN